MADDFYRIGQDLGSIIFRKRNERRKDEQDEKDLRRAAFLRQLMEDEAMKRELVRAKADMEERKYSENKQDYRAHAARGTDLEQARIGAEQRAEAAKLMRDQQARETAARIMDDEITAARRRYEFEATLPGKKQQAAAAFGNSLYQADEAGYEATDDILSGSGWKRRPIKEAEEPSGGVLSGLFGGNRKKQNDTIQNSPTPAPKHPTFRAQGYTAPTNSAVARPLPAPSAGLPPNSNQDIDVLEGLNGLGKLGAKASDFLGTTEAGLAGLSDIVERNAPGPSRCLFRK